MDGTMNDGVVQMEWIHGYKGCAKNIKWYTTHISTNLVYVALPVWVVWVVIISFTKN